jgi:hypothetical protein
MRHWVDADHGVEADHALVEYTDVERRHFLTDLALLKAALAAWPLPSNCLDVAASVVT